MLNQGGRSAVLPKVILPDRRTATVVWAGIIRPNAITVNIAKIMVNTDRITTVNIGRTMDIIDMGDENHTVGLSKKVTKW